jgi:hypothetical protein
MPESLPRPSTPSEALAVRLELLVFELRPAGVPPGVLAPLWEAIDRTRGGLDQDRLIAHRHGLEL